MILFRRVPTGEESDEITFEAVENDAVCGKCHMIFSADKATVDNLCYEPEKPYLVEGLLKSAFNYAALENKYLGYCTCENITPFLDNMNFKKQNGEYYNDIPTILLGICCKKRDNI
ncbi:MAG: hypothetical protein IJ349_04235 [Clostridia bacterium]|nr:hypothetical protein [Clostridia bacterium]